MKCLIIGADTAGMSETMQIWWRQPTWEVTVLERGDFTPFAERRDHERRPGVSVCRIVDQRRASTRRVGEISVN